MNDRRKEKGRSGGSPRRCGGTEVRGGGECAETRPTARQARVARRNARIRASGALRDALIRRASPRDQPGYARLPVARRPRM